MREVPLSLGRYHAPQDIVAYVDDDDFKRVSALQWRLFMASGRRMYAVTNRGTLLHRFVMDAPAGLTVDHINGDGLLCVRSNLRLLTASLAAVKNWSRAVRSPAASSMRGVSLVEGRSRPWRATISVNQKQHFLGYHTDEVGAARAYDAAARLYFGEFAHTNFVVEE